MRRLRTLRHITQEALAVDAQVDRTSISGIENEEFSASIDLLDRLAASLSVDVAELLALPDTSAGEPPTMKPGRKPK